MQSALSKELNLNLLKFSQPTFALARLVIVRLCRKPLLTWMRNGTFGIQFSSTSQACNNVHHGQLLLAFISWVGRKTFATRWGSFSVLIFHFHLLNQLLFQQMNTRACTSAVADVSLLHADFATLLTFTLGRSQWLAQYVEVSSWLFFYQSRELVLFYHHCVYVCLCLCVCICKSVLKRESV